MSDSVLPTRNQYLQGASTWRHAAKNRECRVLSLFCLVPFALLLLIVVPLSFQYLDYYEYGLLKRRSTGSMLLKRVYGAGRYLVGPDMKFKVFQASAHHVALRNVSVVTLDKLETLIDVEYVYFLKKDKLIQLHHAYERHYRPVVEARALDAIKNTAPNHTTADFFLNREALSKSFFLAVNDKLDKVYCSLDLMYLQKATIPNQVSKRQLDTAVQNEVNAQEAFIAQVKLQRQETLRQVNDINNKAALLLTQAEANASVLVANATTQSQHLVDEAHFQGLQGMYRQLGFLGASHKASLDYIRTLKENPGVAWHIGYVTKLATFANTQP